MLICQICGHQHPFMIAPAHIKKHGLSTTEYKAQFPDAILRIQTSESRKKSSTSKKGKPSSIVGIVRSEEYKKKLSNSLKAKYSSGELVHWNTGRTTPDAVKLKISESNKKTINLGNITQNKAKQERMHKAAESFNCSILEIDEETKITKAICNTCNLTFSFTNQIFYPSRLDKIGKLCPICQPRETFSSVSEKQICDFVKCNYSGHVIANDREQLGGKEIDIYIPDLNLGIEFTGLFWHSEKQNPEKNHLLWKTQFASKNGIKLITIFEDEWLLKQDIVKSRVLGMLGQHRETFNARSLTIREVSSIDSRKFLIENHIQGKDTASIRIGLYSSDELVMLTTFKKTNMVKGGNGSNWELSRLCSKLGTRVRGGASKLIKWFQLKHNTEKLDLISYADSRWSTGDLYSAVGFEYAGKSQPSYWYMTDYKSRIHRSSLMKHKLVKREEDKQLTEWQLAQQIGYDRIWDCGTTKWILRPSI